MFKNIFMSVSNRDGKRDVGNDEGKLLQRMLELPSGKNLFKSA